jgi:hypothetical protein
VRYVYIVRAPISGETQFLPDGSRDSPDYWHTSRRESILHPSLWLLCQNSVGVRLDATLAKV